MFAVTSLFGVITQATTINVGHHNLMANTPNQSIGILVEGGDLVSGLDLFVQVGDGGPELALLGLPAGTDGPALTGVELVSGTIFEGVSDVPTDIGSPLLDQVAIYTLSLLGTPSSVPTSGTLATLTVDTTGFYGGTWEVRLSDVLPFPELVGPFTTNFAGQPADSIVNGSITVVPLPGDYDHGGTVGLSDYDIWKATFGSTTLLAADGNGNGRVDAADYTIWRDNLLPNFILPGDYNNDGKVDASDYTVWRDSLGSADESALNGNGDGIAGVDAGDYALWKQSFGNTAAAIAASTIPEPPTWLAALASAIVIACIALRGRASQAADA